MHKISFPAVRDYVVGLVPRAFMSANILIMKNIPSREVYWYVVLFIVDHSSKMSWEFPLKARDYGPILEHLETFVRENLPSLNIRLFIQMWGQNLLPKIFFLFFFRAELLLLPTLHVTLHR